MAEMGTFEASIQQTQPITVAFQRMRGAYDQIPKGFERLYTWLGPRGHQATGMPMAVYFSGPDVPESEAEFETWAPIEDGATAFGPDESGLGIKQIEAMDVAMTRHIGPYERIAETYERLSEWVTDHHFQMSGPPMEIYLSDPEEVPPEKYVTEILIPVREV